MYLLAKVCPLLCLLLPRRFFNGSCVLGVLDGDAVLDFLLGDAVDGVFDVDGIQDRKISAVLSFAVTGVLFVDVLKEAPEEGFVTVLKVAENGVDEDDVVGFVALEEAFFAGIGGEIIGIDGAVD